jgi:hypothetical protein
MYDGVGALESIDDNDAIIDLIGYCSQIGIFVCHDYKTMLQRKKNDNVNSQQLQPYIKVSKFVGNNLFFILAARSHLSI